MCHDLRAPGRTHSTLIWDQEQKSREKWKQRTGGKLAINAAKGGYLVK